MRHLELRCRSLSCQDLPRRLLTTQEETLPTASPLENRIFDQRFRQSALFLSDYLSFSQTISVSQKLFQINLKFDAKEMFANNTVKDPLGCKTHSDQRCVYFVKVSPISPSCLVRLRVSANCYGHTNYNKTNACPPQNHS